MRRDTVTQVIVDYGDFEENFATPYEAQQFITAYEDEYGLPRAAWLEDMSGHTKSLRMIPGTLCSWMIKPLAGSNA